MRSLFTFLMLSLLALPLWAQRLPHELKPIAQEIRTREANNELFTVNGDLFKVASADKGMRTSARIAQAHTLELQPMVLQKLIRENSANLKLTIPTNSGRIALLLYEVNIFSEGFHVTTSDGQQFFPEGKHYRGIIEGNSESLAAISIFNNEVMGIIVDGEGNNVLGKIEGTENDYVLYNDRNLTGAEPPSCHTSAEHIKSAVQDSPEANSGRTEATKCVRAYWEADYEIYQNKGSVSNVTNFLTGLFNQSKIIYDNDGISITLQQIYVWTTSSPYSGQTNTKLGQFRSYRTTFNGDLAHLIHMDGGGGVAYVNALCSNGYNYGVSNINSSYSNYPTYSWSVMVVTHEQGHILGSQHTHDCVWNGNNTAIDHCGGNSCWATEDAPAGGGTVMSYCHLTSTGINLTKGFGTQPKQRITNAINSKGCLTGTCGGSTSPLVHNSVYRIKVRHTGQVMDVSSSSTANGANIVQWPANGGNNQHWRAISLGSDYWRFVNINSGKSLEVGSFSTTNGGKVTQWDWTGAANQQWRINSAGSDYYNVYNRNSNKVLDVKDVSTTSGALIHQWSLANSTNQQWRFELVAASLAETPEASAAVEELNDKVILAPNPANSEVRVFFKSTETKEVEIGLRDMKGLELQSYKFQAVTGANEVTISLPASLMNGLYLIHVNSKTAKLLVKK